MKKATFSKLLLNSKRARIDGLTISDSSKISNLMEKQVFMIDNAEPFATHWRFGKEIIVHVIDKDNKSLGIEIPIGVLNSTKNLMGEIEDYVKKLKNIYIGKMKFGKNDIKSLKSIGINDNFNCKVEFEKDE